MPDNATPLQSQHAKRILENQINVGLEKTVSYLPINTIISVLAMDVSTYRSFFEKLDVKTLVFFPENCCINSGAVYAYHENGLKNLLNINKAILDKNGWSSDPAQFVNRIASEWLDEESPVLPVIRKVFGES